VERKEKYRTPPHSIGTPAAPVETGSIVSEPVLALTQLGEDPGGIGAGHAEPRLDMGVISAQKRICRKLYRDRRRKAPLIQCPLNGGRL
jgi:hypothetical protein